MTSKPTNARQNKEIKSIRQKLNSFSCEKHAKESGFQKRKAQKIDGKALLLSFFFMVIQGSNSFLLWAVQMNNLTGLRVSKQGVWKRITPCFTKFLMAVLTDAFKQQVGYAQDRLTKGVVKLNEYKRILIQDRTVIALPDWLCWCFPGSTSKGKRKAQLKIQVIFDVKNNTFIHFEITPYTANDQSKAEDILILAEEGDLLIRDLGYFALESFKKMNLNAIDYVSRLRNGVKIYDIASCYITSVAQKDFSATEVPKIYGLRWRIENIFKCWKSQFHLQQIIPKGCSLTKDRVEAIIYMMLIFILLLQVTVYNYMMAQDKNKDDRIISLAKLCNYITNNITLFLENSLKELVPDIQYYCSYDKRINRKNFVQIFS